MLDGPALRVAPMKHEAGIAEQWMQRIEQQTGVAGVERQRVGIGQRHLVGAHMQMHRRELADDAPADLHAVSLRGQRRPRQPAVDERPTERLRQRELVRRRQRMLVATERRTCV